MTTKRLIDANEIYDAVENRYRVSSGIEHRCERDFLDLICSTDTVDAIPIAVIKRAIAGISLADQCDQAGRWDYELRSALQTVLKWYGSPAYKEHEKRTQQVEYGR